MARMYVLSLLIGTAFACTTPMGTKVDEDTGADPNEIGDKDLDADADTDTDVECGIEDMDWRAEIRDEAGLVGTEWTSSDSLELWAVVENTCSSTLRFSSTSGCLADRWRMRNDSGEYWTGTLLCAALATRRELDSGETLEEWMGFLGTLDADSYTAGVSFTTTDPTSTSGSVFYGEAIFRVVR